MKKTLVFFQIEKMGGYFMFNGSMVALVTPMKEDESIDFKAIYNLIEMHLENQTSGIVLGGSTGESATLEVKEKYDLVQKVVKYTRGRVPIIAGSNDNGTKRTAQLTHAMMELGVDACLLSSPAYIKPMSHGLVEHFKYIAKTVPIPQIIYNHPGRTGVDLTPDIIEELSQFSNIVGVKEACGKVERVKILHEKFSNKLDIYAGDDQLLHDMMLAGAKGVISVAANIIPGKIKMLSHLLLSGKHVEAKQLNGELKNIFEFLTVETNPIPIKWLLANKGFIQNVLRLPLTPLSQLFFEKGTSVLKDIN